VYVIDASVHVADARPQEPKHREARALLACVAAEGLPVYLPEIVLAEVAAAISRGTGRAEVAQRLAATLRRVPHFAYVAVDAALGDLAAQISARYQIRGCDAVYVALALERNATLITLDQQQRVRVPAGIIARTPAEELAVRGW
jgi:predicted nucleic acid-binding protein